MTWHWRKSAACDLDGLLDDLNPQMKDLEGELQDDRPAVMSGYPKARGVITLPLTVSHTGDTTETTLKTFDFGRGALRDKSGFRVTAAGVCNGAGAAKDIKLKWGNETILTLSVQAGSTKYWSLVAEFWNRTTTQDQIYQYKAWDGTTLEQIAVGVIQVDTL